jgi:eukaryotic-like serine/threonine-protein kinase
MTPERRDQVQQIFEAAGDVQGAEREAYLDHACAGDADLRDRVEKLLAVDEWKSAVDHSPSTETAVIPILPPDREGADRVGRYRLLQKIGEGGMGEVWLAEQREPVRRRVALKLVKAGMNTREVMARFESERQALALMDHPAIAKVFDASSTPEGAPYFVMEYVAGVPITTYCDNHRLSTRERLELFVHVCEGVQHAHQKAIIHRDLKPSNILVTEVDGRAAPKIIDFGVAKALAQKLSADTMFTRVGALIGTPEYMSPEQANSSGQDIDTRTDVYSLGVIFYELLAGTPPIDLRKIAFEEFLRRLREEEPPKPSTKVRTQGAAKSTDVAHKRHTAAPELAKQIRGDLDAIALKALEKDRARRYGSPSDFGADIGRYLNHQAVLAVPPSAAYRARKFARRYRTALATIAAFILVLVVAAIVSIRQSIRANREAAVAQAVNDFLQNDLLAQASASTQASQSTKPDPDLKVRTALDRAAARIGGKFERQPEVEAAIRDTIGQTYGDLGLYTEARHQFERALELQRRVLGKNDARTLATAMALGHTVDRQGKWPDAEVILRETLETQRRVLGSEHPETLATMLNLASVYQEQGKYSQAEAIGNQVLEIRRRVSGPEHPYTLKSMHNLALLYHEQGNEAQAETLYSQLVKIRRRVIGPEHPDTLASVGNLGLIYRAEGKLTEAEALWSQNLEIERRVLGPEHPDTLMTMNNLITVDVDLGRFALAAMLAGQVLEIRERVLGPEHPDTLQSMHNVGWTEFEEGRYAEAEAVLSQTMEARRRVLGPEHAKTLLSMRVLALVYSAEGKYVRAESLLNRTLEISRRVLGPEHPNSLYTLSNLGEMYQREGKYDLAGAYHAQALAGHRHAQGSDQPETMANAADLAQAYVSQGKFAESETVAREAVEFFRKKQPDDPTRFIAESLLGASLAGQKKYAEAEPLLLGAYEGLMARKERIAVPDRWQVDQASEWITQLYQAWGKPTKAAEWKQSKIAAAPR